MVMVVAWSKQATFRRRTCSRKTFTIWATARLFTSCGSALFWLMKASVKVVASMLLKDWEDFTYLHTRKYSSSCGTAPPKPSPYSSNMTKELVATCHQGFLEHFFNCMFLWFRKHLGCSKVGKRLLFSMSRSMAEAGAEPMCAWPGWRKQCKAVRCTLERLCFLNVCKK